MKFPGGLTKEERAAWERVGGLSEPSKMPGFAYSTPAQACPTGQKLREVPGSVCSGCYALKGRYVFGNVKQALERRLEAQESDRARWVEDMVTVLGSSPVKGTGYFRWHDSGDIQGEEHFRAILEVVKRTPWLKHWVPTREYRTVATVMQNGELAPLNITVRVSAPMIGQKPVTGSGNWNTSTVGAGVGRACPAREQENQCGDCRACWDKRVKNVDYQKH